MLETSLFTLAIMNKCLCRPNVFMLGVTQIFSFITFYNVKSLFLSLMKNDEKLLCTIFHYTEYKLLREPSRLYTSKPSLDFTEDVLQTLIGWKVNITIPFLADGTVATTQYDRLLTS